MFCALSAHGRALTFAAIPEPENIELEIAWRSDLWTSPMVDKRTPVRIYDASAVAPFFRNKNWIASVKLDTEGVSSGRPDLVVGRNRVLIGSDLRMQEYGVYAQRRGEDDSRFSFSAAYDSASDEPFKSARDRWTEFQAVYVTKVNSDDYQWIFATNYSKNRGFLNNRLIPMIGVNYRPLPGLDLTLGFPFARFIWKDDLYDLNFLATPAGFSFVGSKTINPTVTGRLRAGLANRAYLHENRIEDDMRLFFQETYADGGFRTRLTSTTTIEILLGASIDRSFYEAKQVYQPVGNRTTLPADFYGRIRMEFSL